MARNFPITGGSNTDWLSVSNIAVTAAPLSMAAWIYQGSYGRNWYILAEVDSASGTSEGFMLQGNSSGGILASTAAAGSTRSSTTGTYSTGAWHHAGAVFASATSRVAYLDGSPAAANTESRTPGSMASSVIGYQPGGGTAATLLVAEAAIWNVALTDADMLELAAGFSPDQVRPESLVRYWRITGRNSPEIDIRSGVAMSLNGTCAFADHPRIIYRPTQIVVPAASVAAAQDTPELYGRPFGSHGQQQQQQLLSF